MADLHARLAAAERAAREAGEALRHHGRIQVRAKADNDFVTEMDVKTERALRAALLGAFPEDEFLGEESGGAERAAGRWIVDPDRRHAELHARPSRLCDLHRLRARRARCCIGCVYMPDTDEMFCAIRGEGATLNGEPIHVSDIADPHQAIAHLGYGHRCKPDRDRTMRLLPGLFDRISDIRRFGSAAYALCCVACGRSEIFFELGLHIYDVAAGAVILRRGGRARDRLDGGRRLARGARFSRQTVLLHDFMLRQLAPESNT